MQQCAGKTWQILPYGPLLSNTLSTYSTICQISSLVLPRSTFLQALANVPRQRLKDLHVWGCPVYVLEPALQDGKKIPRWKPRSRRAVFLWLSPQYASTVPLVLNPATSHISPQFHVIFDDLFSTVVSTLESSEEPPIQWEDLCIKHRYQVEFEENDPVALNDEWLTPEELLHQRNQVAQDRIVPPPTLIEPTSPLPDLNIPTSL